MPTVIWGISFSLLTSCCRTEKNSWMFRTYYLWSLNILNDKLMYKSVEVKGQSDFECKHSLRCVIILERNYYDFTCHALHVGLRSADFKIKLQFTPMQAGTQPLFTENLILNVRFSIGIWGTSTICNGQELTELFQNIKWVAGTSIWKPKLSPQLRHDII